MFGFLFRRGPLTPEQQIEDLFRGLYPSVSTHDGTGATRVEEDCGDEDPFAVRAAQASILIAMADTDPVPRRAIDILGRLLNMPRELFYPKDYDRITATCSQGLYERAGLGKPRTVAPLFRAE